MSSTAGLLPPAAYVLPKDLSEAACMGFDVTAAAAAASMGCCDSSSSAPPTAGSATARMGAFTIADDAGSATATGSSPAAAGSSASAGSSAMAGGFLSAQLSNSSFYKPLSSISLPGRRASSAAAAAAAEDADSGDSRGADAKRADSDAVAALLAGSMPAISLAEVNAALNALVEQGSADLWAADGGVGVGALKRGLAAEEGGCGAPLLPPGKRRRGGGLALDSDYDDDDWLLAMDQLVDTEALLTKSPPPTPADAPPQRLVSAARMDPLARWDRIPVNIFRRSRALASSHHRRDIAAQDGLLMGGGLGGAGGGRSGGAGMSALALTAIKSSRQRRALVNSTLLAQHTLPLAPPPPPPTPLGSRSASMSAAGASTCLPHSLVSADGGANYAAVSALATSAAASPASLLAARSGALAGRRRSAAAVAGHRVASSSAADAVAAAADSIYAFGWLEDDEDLALFAMPELSSTHDAPPSMTMMLAASAVSPMLRPFGGSSSSAAADAVPEPKLQ
ncbi:hypothetical protein GGF44_003389 [Coemansia sp. RSA 1694]|nr:hypothetical protein GGF44_003389 [Coemansia sp. RSA 1694]